MQTDANSIHHCSANLNVTELQAATGSDGSCLRTAARSESAGRRSNSSQTARCAPSGNVFTAYSIMSKRITEEWTGDAMGFVARRSRGDAGPDEMRPSFEAETSDVDAFEQNPSSYGGCATMISRMIHELRYLEAFQFHHVRLPVIAVLVHAGQVLGVDDVSPTGVVVKPPSRRLVPSLGGRCRTDLGINGI